MKHLIISAEDFGYSPVFNRIILHLGKYALISSTSVMIHRIASKTQKDQLKKLCSLEETGTLSIGLHFEFESFHLEEHIKDQLHSFTTMLGRFPSHFDIHKPESYATSIELVTEYAHHYHVPCRNYGQDLSGVPSTDNRYYCGTYYFGHASTFSDIKSWLGSLQENSFNELVFHPGQYDPDCRSSLNIGREIDVEIIETLPSLIKQHGITLSNFYDLAQRTSIPRC